VLAGALAAVFALKTYEKWSRITHTERIGRCATLLVLTIVALFIVLQLRRPPDLISFGALNLSPKHMLAVSALKLRDAFTGSFLLSVPILFASLWWFQQRRVLLTYLVGTGGLLILAGIAYSNVWHEGPLVLWWAFVMWIGWPKQSARIPRAVFACWAVFLMVHLFWSARSSWFDLRFPYSGSKQLAAYIQSQQLYRHNIFAFGPKSAAVLPYFQQGIFANWPSGRSFWFWSTSNKIESTFVDIPRLRPEFVILSVTRDGDHDLALRRQSLRSLGYCLSQRFDGALFWKTRILEGNFYELYATAPSNSETVNNCRESF
jgi:hypothetical protein